MPLTFLVEEIMNLQVAVNNLMFDLSEPLCSILTYEEKYAFIQALEFNLDGEKHIKRYWGKWNSNNPIKSIEKILRKRKPWPNLPPSPKKENNLILFHDKNTVVEPTLIDAYEAIDRALYDANMSLEPNIKREAATQLYQAYKEGDVDSISANAVSEILNLK